MRYRQHGFTYLGLIVFVMIIGLVGAATLKIGSLLQRAQAEEELLFIGAAFSDALQSYAAATPKGQAPFPPTLKELLRDPRFPGMRRHLRQIYADPMTGKAEWGIVWQHDNKGVLAVYSLSSAKPLKIGNFDARFAGFDNKKHLSDWKFAPPGQAVFTPVNSPLTPPPNEQAPMAPPPAPTPPAAEAPPPPPEEKPQEEKPQQEKAQDTPEAKPEEEKPNVPDRQQKPEPAEPPAEAPASSPAA